jgi:hypothetical protein
MGYRELPGSVLKGDIVVKILDCDFVIIDTCYHESVRLFYKVCINKCSDTRLHRRHRPGTNLPEVQFKFRQ